MVWDDAGGKNWRLAEVLGFIYNCGDVYVVSANQADNLVDLALLNLIEEGPVENTLLAHLLHGCMLRRCHLTVLSYPWSRRLLGWLLVGRRYLSSSEGMRFGHNSLLSLLIFSEDWLYNRVLSRCHSGLLCLINRRLSLSNFAEPSRKISVGIVGTL